MLFWYRNENKKCENVKNYHSSIYTTKLIYFTSITVVNKADSLLSPLRFCKCWTISLLFSTEGRYFVNSQNSVASQKFAPLSSSLGFFRLLFRKSKHTRDHSSWIIRNGDPMHNVHISRRIPRSWEQQWWKGNHSKRVLWNMEES